MGAVRDELGFAGEELRPLIQAWCDHYDVSYHELATRAGVYHVGLKELMSGKKRYLTYRVTDKIFSVGMGRPDLMQQLTPVPNPMIHFRPNRCEEDMDG